MRRGLFFGLFLVGMLSGFLVGCSRLAAPSETGTSKVGTQVPSRLAEIRRREAKQLSFRIRARVTAAGDQFSIPSTRLALAAKLPSSLRVDLLPDQAAYALGVFTVQRNGLIYLNQPERKAYCGDLRSALDYLGGPELSGLSLAALLLAKPSWLLTPAFSTQLEIQKGYTVFYDSLRKIKVAYDDWRPREVVFGDSEMVVQYDFSAALGATKELQGFPGLMTVTRGDHRLELEYQKVKTVLPRASSGSFTKLFALDIPSAYELTEW